MSKTYTKGNVIVEEIKVGDIHYEYDLGLGIKVEVLTLPQRSEDGYWTWQSKQISTGREITYGVREGFSHYAPNLYDHEAYTVRTIL
jgi:hypothetical protein